MLIRMMRAVLFDICNLFTAESFQGGIDLNPDTAITSHFLVIVDNPYRGFPVHERDRGEINKLEIQIFNPFQHILPTESAHRLDDFFLKIPALFGQELIIIADPGNNLGFL